MASYFKKWKKKSVDLCKIKLQCCVKKSPINQSPRFSLRLQIKFSTKKTTKDVSGRFPAQTLLCVLDWNKSPSTKVMARLPTTALAALLLLPKKLRLRRDIHFLKFMMGNGQLYKHINGKWERNKRGNPEEEDNKVVPERKRDAECDEGGSGKRGNGFRGAFWIYLFGADSSGRKVTNKRRESNRWCSSFSAMADGLTQAASRDSFRSVVLLHMLLLHWQWRSAIQTRDSFNKAAVERLHLADDTCSQRWGNWTNK